MSVLQGFQNLENGETIYNELAFELERLDPAVKSSIPIDRHNTLLDLVGANEGLRVVEEEGNLTRLAKKGVEDLKTITFGAFSFIRSHYQERPHEKNVELLQVSVEHLLIPVSRLPHVKWQEIKNRWPNQEVPQDEFRIGGYYQPGGNYVTYGQDLRIEMRNHAIKTGNHEGNFARESVLKALYEKYVNAIFLPQDLFLDF
jgi:hypothetical protein